MDSDTLKLLNALDRANGQSTPNAGAYDEGFPRDTADGEFTSEFTGEFSSEADGEIIKAFLERDEKAISAAMEKYGAQTVGIAQRFLQNREDAEQCANDALLRVWDSVPPNRPRELMPYLARIVKNLALNRLRAEGTEKRGGSAVSEVFAELENTISSSGSAEERLESNELRAAINGFLGTLKASHRKMFLMRYWFCCDLPEIAARLGKSEGTVAVTLNRIRVKLKAYLQKRGYDL